METYEFNDQIKFLLPSGFVVTREEDDEGEEFVKISAGEYENDDGETCYRFRCRVAHGEYDSDDVDDDVTSENMLDKLAERIGESHHLKLPGTPETVFISQSTSFSIWGRLIKMFTCICLVRTSDWSALRLVASTQMKDDDPAEFSFMYENMCEVLKAVRINGKKPPVEGVSPRMLQDALAISSEEDEEAVDISPKLQIKFSTGDETTTYEYTADGTKEVRKAKLNQVAPDEKLYPHYNSKIAGPARMLSMLGAQVNATGTEYAFMSLRKEVEDPEFDLSEEGIATLKRLVAADNGNYNLHKKAEQMVPLFRVDSSVFDDKHDRECELAEGYMHRSYMMSALRSFAWSLSDWCEQNDVEPATLTYNELCRIISFASMHNWLNYDETYCNGLCGCQDLHVYYLPDGASDADKRALLPSARKLAEVEEIRAKLPHYNPILSTVHSLGALRKDLEYIFPAIETIYAQLEAERDRMQPLTGDVADILYAWCALALAAKEPFFTEDGPVNCWFDQKTEPIIPYVITMGNKITLEQASDDANVKECVVEIEDGWSIAVPEGFSYSNDISKNGESPCNPHGRYDLIIAQPKSNYFVNFDDPYSNRIVFVTLDRIDFMTAQKYYDYKNAPEEWITVKRTPDLTVKYTLFDFRSTVSTYQVIVESKESCRRCQVLINARMKKEDRAAFVEQMLSTIEPLSKSDDEARLEQASNEHFDESDAEGENLSALDLPDGVYRVDGNYAVIDDDWAVRLPDGWVYSTDPEITRGRSFVANSGEDYLNNEGVAIYSDNCFTVFQKSENSAVSMLAGSLLNQDADALISRSNLQVTYNCHHDGDTTYCQYVIVTTRRATYMIQFFYTDPKLNEYGRINEIEKILRTICLAAEVPDNSQNPDSITPVDNTSVLQKYYATARAAINRKEWETVRDTYAKIERQCPGDLEAGYFVAVAKLRLMDGSTGTYQRKENVDRFINALRSIIDNHRKIQAEEIMPLIERIHISIIDVTKARFVFKVTSDHDDMLYLMGLTAGTYERMLKELLPYVPGKMENNVDALCSKMIEAIAAGECESDSPGLKMTIREEIADVHEFWKSKNPNHVIPAIYSSVKASNTNHSSNTSGGCYVATAVYGSYDCPQVWTLRRFRDNTLAETWYGRAFIRTYYAISPTLVKWFGHIEWLKKMWKSTLDRMVAKLNAEGVEDTPYEDKDWQK